MTASVSLPNPKYKEPKQQLGFCDRLNRGLTALPGVQAAGLGTDLPWTGYDEKAGGLHH